MIGLILAITYLNPQSSGKSDNNNTILRFSLLLGFSFLNGLSLGPLLQYTFNLDPRLIMTAFLMSTGIFSVFSVWALLAQRRSWLYIGGFLSTCLTMLVIASFANMFFRSAFIFNSEIYLGLLVFSLFVIFDTQMIVEKASLGDKDFIGHSLQLFMDFLNIFIRILLILSKDKKKEKKRE